MMEVRDAEDLPLSEFEKIEHAHWGTNPPWLRRLRKAAFARFGELGFPTTRNEDWKFTNLGPLGHYFFALPPHGDAPQPAGVEGDHSPGTTITLINGTPLVATHRQAKLPNGVIVCGLAEALVKHPALLEQHLGRYGDYRDYAMNALNTAFLGDGAFIYLPKRTIVEQPIWIKYVIRRAGALLVWNQRALIVAEQDSQATIVESFAGRKDEGTQYATMAVTEVVIGPNAAVDHYKVQDERLDVIHIAHTAVHQARDSKFSTHYIGLGGGRVRNEVRVTFAGEGSEATVNGLYMASGNQHHDTLTVIDHAKPHCASHELYKGILDGKAHGVFNGKIFVREDAQKTDAKQTNQTLLLSEDATINTKPQLEIFADDVKCTHGATVGNLDDEAIFYLRSRGIGAAEARSLLTFAFANDIISRIKIEPLRVQLEEHLLDAQHLPRGKWTEEETA